MFLQTIIRPENLVSQKTNETLTRFHLNLECKNHDWELLESIITSIKTISSRDTFEFSIEIEGSDITITNYTQPSIDQLNDHYEENKDESDLIHLNLIISKNLSNHTISIYALQEFLHYFNALPFLNRIDAISSIFDEKITFEVFNEIKKFGSKTISFRPKTEDTEEPESNSISQRREKLSKFQDNATLVKLKYQFTPDDFYFDTSESTNNELKSFFSKVRLLYSLAYISNTTELTENNLIKFRINGYKTFITKEQSPDNLNESSDLAYKIYTWVYSEGQCGDKLGLVRNILTLDASNGRLNLNNSTWNTIQSNYEIYLKKNISQYLELKSKLLEYVTEFNRRALEATDAFTNSFQSNTIAFITFIVTVVAINGIKDAGVEKIFSWEYLLISTSICVISTTWMLFSKFDTNRRIEYLIAHTRNSISQSYSSVLSEEEINESTQITISSIRKHTSEKILTYTWLWSTITVLFLTLFVVGYILSRPTPTTAKECAPVILKYLYRDKLNPIDFL
jgi:hypothetical protein